MVVNVFYCQQIMTIKLTLGNPIKDNKMLRLLYVLLYNNSFIHVSVCVCVCGKKYPSSVNCLN